MAMLLRVIQSRNLLSVQHLAYGERMNRKEQEIAQLKKDWAAGKYHPLPYTRQAVEAATVERMTLMPR